jgi:quercetin dioxygenase-like cupin family protein
MRSRNLAYGLFVSLFAFGPGSPLMPPMLHTTSKTTVVDLGPEFPGMEGRQLRLRLLTIEPGGHIGLHNHKERPAVVYFLQGTDTVIQDDGTSQIFKAGDVTGEPGSAIRWHRNDGQDTVIFVTADIFKPAS